MKAISIKGKDYIPVNERLKEFRTNPKYEGWGMVDEVIQFDGMSILIRTTITDSEGKIVGTGLAHEMQSSSNINKTSFVENAQTSSWGRALGNIGIGIDTSVASADEMKHAVEQQEILDRKIGKDEVDALIAKCIDKNIPEQKILDNYKVLKFEDLNTEQWINAMRRLEKSGEKG